MAGYSGTWKRTRTVPRGDVIIGHPEYSELHMRPDFDPGGSRPPEQAPRAVLGPPAITDDMRAYDPVQPHEAPGLVLDMPQVRTSHEDGVTASGGQSEALARAEANAARSQDTGTLHYRSHEAARTRGHDEDWQTPRTELPMLNEGSRSQVLLQIKSGPEVNPEGDAAGGPVRQGYRVRRYMDRLLWNRWREHDERAVHTRLAAAPVDAPGVPVGNRRVSPFGTLQVARGMVPPTPVVRRVPRPWDEDSTIDGTELGEASGFVAWGL